MDVILKDKSKSAKKTEGSDKRHPIEKSLSSIKRRLKQRGIMDPITFKQIWPKETTILRMYGLSKLHANGLPLRPTLDTCNSPSHAVAKWPAELLETVRQEGKA